MIDTAKIMSCQKCILRKTCCEVIVDGNIPGARLMIVGLAPTEDEDLMISCFTGRAGMYIRKALVEAHIPQSDVHYSYLVKCYPKGPIPKESVAACKTWLWHEIEQVKPKVIVTLGLVASALLLKRPKLTMNEAAGVVSSVPYMSAKIAPWYSAEYLLNRGKSDFKLTVAFFNQIKSLLS